MGMGVSRTRGAPVPIRGSANQLSTDVLSSRKECRRQPPRGQARCRIRGRQPELRRSARSRGNRAEQDREQQSLCDISFLPFAGLANSYVLFSVSASPGEAWPPRPKSAQLRRGHPIDILCSCCRGLWGEAAETVGNPVLPSTGASGVLCHKTTKRMIILIKTIKITIDYGSIGELRFLRVSENTGIALRDSDTAGGIRL